MAWIKANMFSMARGGTFEARFWEEIDRRVRTIPLDDFWGEIDARVAAKPKRSAPRGSRTAPAARPQALSVEEKRALRQVVAQLVVDRELRDQVATMVRDRAKRERSGR